jgi:hypothetical protein
MLEHLRGAWKEGMESDDFLPLDLAALKAEGRRLLSSGDQLPSSPVPRIPALRKIH